MQLSRSPRSREKLRLKDHVPCCCKFSSPTFGGCLYGVGTFAKPIREAPQRSSKTVPISQTRFPLPAITEYGSKLMREKAYNALLFFSKGKNIELHSLIFALL